MAEDQVKVDDTFPANGEVKDENQERVNEFLTKYGELVKEMNLDFASYPVWVPDGTGGFKTVIQNTPVDITNQPRKSPFVAP